MRIRPLTITLVLALLVAGCGDSSAEPVEVTGFDAASGTYYAGEEAISSLQIKNTSNEAKSFWIGYSV